MTDIEVIGGTMGEAEQTTDECIPHDTMDAAPEEMKATAEVSPVELIRQVRQLAKLAGGMNELRQLLEALG